jgi:hypothetical protein
MCGAKPSPFRNLPALLTGSVSFCKLHKICQEIFQKPLGIFLVFLIQ